MKPYEQAYPVESSVQIADRGSLEAFQRLAMAPSARARAARVRRTRGPSRVRRFLSWRWCPVPLQERSGHLAWGLFTPRRV